MMIESKKNSPLQSPEKSYKLPLHLMRRQISALLKRFSEEFLPSNSIIKTTIINASEKINNPQQRQDIEEVPIINPNDFLQSLAEYGPETKFAHSILGSGKNGIEAAENLRQLSAEFETIVIYDEKAINPQNKSFRKLPLELQLLILKNQPQIKNFLNEEGVFLFVKRRKIPDEIVNIIYQLSQYTGRRLDWINDWFSSKENSNGFDYESYFGRLNEKEKKEINKLLADLENLSHYFFQLIPVDKDGNVDGKLENNINVNLQNIENFYRNLLISQADLEEELKTTQWAFLLSIPGLFAINHLMENNPVLARFIPPALADILTLWAETSPFINRNLPPKKRIIEFAQTIKNKYKFSVASSFVLSILGSQLVNQLEQSEKLIAAGFAYAFIPFVGALITTYQSFLQEYNQGKRLKEKAVNGYDELTDYQLKIKSLLKTIKHPARLYLLLAGFLGIGEGVVLGAYNLLDNPLALTYVGELNESVLTTIGLFFHLKTQNIEYIQTLKENIKNCKTIYSIKR